MSNSTITFSPRRDVRSRTCNQAQVLRNALLPDHESPPANGYQGLFPGDACVSDFRAERLWSTGPQTVAPRMERPEPFPANATTPSSPSSTDTPSLPTVADHQLIRIIGRGAYGEVWLAKNHFGSFRAVKVVRRSSFEHDRPYEREFNGIRIVAGARGNSTSARISASLPQTLPAWIRKDRLADRSDHIQR